MECGGKNVNKKLLVNIHINLNFFIIKPQILKASTTADVKYDGKGLSVYAEEFPFDQLLSMVEKQTSIHFSYDDSLSEENVYANFENNSLDDGIVKIDHELDE